MGRKKKSTSAKPTRSAAKPPQPPLRERLGAMWSGAGGRVLRVLAVALLAAGVLGGAVYGLHRVEQMSLAGEFGPVRQDFRVQLADVPDWMPSDVRRRIEHDLTPPDAKFNDPDLAAAVYERALKHPRLRDVTLVRKVSGDNPTRGVVRVSATVRHAVAKVQLLDSRGQAYYVYVDAEGVVLPWREIRRWEDLRANRPANEARFLTQIPRPTGIPVRPVHYPVIRHVAATSPQVGRPLGGADLADALRLWALLAARPYAGEVTEIDVKNHDGRASASGDVPQILFRAQTGRGGVTEIWWGRFPDPRGDHVLSTKRKLENLDGVVGRVGRGHLAGWAYRIDLRHDRVHYVLD